jgi:hypothetical protein
MIVGFLALLFPGKTSVLRTKHQYSIEKPQEKYSTP